VKAEGFGIVEAREYQVDVKVDAACRLHHSPLSVQTLVDS
jgi:hypothetical protein